MYVVIQLICTSTGARGVKGKASDRKFFCYFLMQVGHGVGLLGYKSRVSCYRFSHCLEGSAPSLYNVYLCRLSLLSPLQSWS